MVTKTKARPAKAKVEKTNETPAIELSEYPIKIVQKRLADLIHASYNPRKITNEAMHGLKKSLKKFGYMSAITWNKRTGHIVGGHRRLDAMIEESRGNNVTVDVQEVDVPLEEEKAMNVALNNPHIQGDFDTEKLPDLLEEIKIDMPEMEFEELKFDHLELKLGNGAEEKENDIDIDLKDSPASQKKEEQCSCPKCGFEWVK